MQAVTFKTIERDENVEQIRAGAIALLQRAAMLGVVLTIANEPLPPLAMGRYHAVVDARRKRDEA
jgi:hypothetical protein